MAIVVYGNYIPREKAVRVLGYEAEPELDGDTLETVNAGTVECEIGSFAIKIGGTDIMMLKSDGEWHGGDSDAQ